MDSTLLTATAAALGSLVGASASIITTWITQRTQTRRANAARELRDRESLYKEFITEASRLALDAMVHSLERPDQLVTLYAILSRIRLLSSDAVLNQAEDCCRRILRLYRRPNMTSDQFRAAFEAHEADLLKDFSAACRVELVGLAKSI